MKDEGRNPTASFKDRASAVVVARTRELKAEIVVTASTGNAGGFSARPINEGSSTRVQVVPSGEVQATAADDSCAVPTTPTATA